MYPVPLFHVFGHGINLYLLTYSFALLPALVMGLYLARERGVSLIIVIDMWFIGFVAGLGGGRLFDFLGSLARPLVEGKAALWAMLLGGGIASLGGIISAMVCLGLFLRFHPATRDRYGEALDIVFPVVSLCQVLARIGCFSAGCCHGRPAFDLPWAVTFSHPATACIYKGIPVHPTQLYMVGGNLVILVILLALRNRPFFKGSLIWLYLLAYGLLRLVVEFYRGDVRPMIGVLSINQVVCLIFLMLGGFMLARRFVVNPSARPESIRFDQGALTY